MNKTKPIIIFGSGRSGTTWVQDVIAKSENLTPLFEPLHPCVGEVANKYANKYLTENDQAKDLHDFVKGLLNDDYPKTWINYRSIPARLAPCFSTFKSINNLYELYIRYKNYFKRVIKFNKSFDGIVIKFIRANLLIRWLYSKFDFDCILVLRHPCAVIESKIRLDKAARQSRLQYGFGDWDPEVVIDGFLRNVDLRNKYILPYFNESEIRGMCPVAKHALIWAVENKVAVEACLDKDIYICFYEKLVLDADIEWSKISNKLGLLNQITPDQLSKPSQQASRDFTSQADIEDKLSRWEHRLNDDDKKSIQMVLDTYNISFYSCFESSPNAEALTRERGL